MTTITTTNTQYYSDIAQAIRTKYHTASTYAPSEMAPALATLKTSNYFLHCPDFEHIEDMLDFYNGEIGDAAFADNGFYFGPMYPSTVSFATTIVKYAYVTSTSPKSIAPISNRVQPKYIYNASYTATNNANAVCSPYPELIVFPAVTSLAARGSDANLSSWCCREAFYQKVVTVGGFAFQGAKNLTRISLPACTTLNSHAFKNCSSLAEAYLPNLKTLQKATFENTALPIVDFPNVYNLASDYIFKSCQASIITIGSNTLTSNPTGITLGSHAFSMCINLKEVNLPTVSALPAGGYAFAGCKNLEIIKLELLKSDANIYNNFIFSNNLSFSTNVTNIKKFYAPQLSLTANTAAATSTRKFFEQLHHLTECTLSNFSASTTPTWIAASIASTDLDYPPALADVYGPDVQKIYLLSPRQSLPYTGIPKYVVTPLIPQCTEWPQITFTETTTLPDRISSVFSKSVNATINMTIQALDMFPIEYIWRYSGTTSTLASTSPTILYPVYGLNLPKVTQVPSSYFKSQYGLKQFDAEQCVVVNAWGFQDCYNLNTVNLPACTVIQPWGFDGCMSLASISLPNCRAIAGWVFRQTDLKELVLPKLEVIDGYAFDGCNKLQSAYLLSTSMVSISATNTSHAFPSTTKIYVPANLIDTYKNNSAWSWFASQFVAYH